MNEETIAVIIDDGDTTYDADIPSSVELGSNESVGLWLDEWMEDYWFPGFYGRYIIRLKQGAEPFSVSIHVRDADGYANLSFIKRYPIHGN